MATTTNDISSNKAAQTTRSMERRRAFVRQQEAQRRTFHDQTSFKVFPLQSLAIQDYDNLMRVYRAVDANADAGATEEGVSVVIDVDNGNADTQQKPVTTTTESQSNSISYKNNNDDDQSSKPHTDNDGCHSSTEESNLNNTVVEEEVKKDVVLQQESPHDNNKSSSSLSSSSFSSTSTLWSKEPRLFAMETTVCGKRRYISTHLGRFMDRYWKECTVDTRHYYELIKEDAPCRLYFGK
jgi:hypothetical protein